MSMNTLEEPIGSYRPGSQQAPPNGGSGLAQRLEQEGVSAGDPKQVAAQAVDQAKEKAGQAAATAKEMVKGQVDDRTSQAGSQASSIARDLRKAAESLRSEGSQTFVADLAERAAGTVEQAAGYLETADLETLLEDFKRVGRQRPLAVAGGLFALGFAASRVIKVSGQTGQE